MKRTFEIRDQMMKEEKLDETGLPAGKTWQGMVEKLKDGGE